MFLWETRKYRNILTNSHIVSIATQLTNCSYSKQLVS